MDRVYNHCSAGLAKQSAGICMVKDSISIWNIPLCKVDVFFGGGGGGGGFISS